jgi:hypothetical protein
MRVTMILPALTEATSPLFRPIGYSLFPPLGLDTLAGYLDPDDRDAFFEGGTSLCALAVDDALDVEGRHLYILDDHLLGNRRFAESLFDGAKGMGRLWQAAGTVNAVLKPGLLERAVEAGLRSLFVGSETVNDANLAERRKNQNIGTDHAAAVRRLYDAGVMVNAGFVFGLDQSGPDVFDSTVEWAASSTATGTSATPAMSSTAPRE